MNISYTKLIAQIIRFGIVGAICTIIHYGLYMLLCVMFGANIAYIIGYLGSFVVNFYLTAYFTFNTSASWQRLIGMVGAHSVNFLLHILLLNIFLFIGIKEALAPIPVFAIAIPINFLLVRFVFNRK